jgi:raffinose/stachyose/melibiose transport system substrate-binding protein
MKKKHAGLVAIFVLTLLAGCNKTEKTEGASARQVILYNNKIEITGVLDAMAAEYNAGHANVTLVVNTTGSDAYAAELKTRFAGGEEPDIFVITGTEQMLLYLEYLEDLSGQGWIADMVDIAKPNISQDGKIYGFPVGIEGYGYMYNKNAFAKAGIAKVPLTLKEFADAAGKLKASGYAYPFVNTFGEWYQSGMFYFNAALAQQEDPFAFIEGLNKGTETIIGNKAFAGLADMINIDFAGCESPLNTDFSAQVSGFAGERAAISMGGTWNQPTLDDANPGMNVGLMPLPFMDGESANDVLYAGVTNYWSVNKNSASKEDAKEFLNWLVNDTAGRRYLTTEMKNIPAFKSIAADNTAIGPLGQSLAEYLSAGKVRGIYNSRYSFSATQEFGTSIQKYAAGKINRQQLLQEFQSAWDSNKAN